MKASGAQLATLAALYDNGTLRPVLDRTFPFDETVEAMAYVDEIPQARNYITAPSRGRYVVCIAC